MDENLRREIILENYQNPCNKETVNSEKYIKVNSNNESCIDNINIYLWIEDNIVKDIKFDGEACAISTSSTSIMISNLIGKSIEEVKFFVNNFDNMLNENNYDEELLGDAIVYNEIYKQSNRKNCAFLPYKGIIKAIKEYEYKKLDN